jgi:hypothetical protein
MILFFALPLLASVLQSQRRRWVVLLFGGVWLFSAMQLLMPQLSV